MAKELLPVFRPRKAPPKPSAAGSDASMDGSADLCEESMKRAVVFGQLGSDGEYPILTLCDEFVEGDEARREESQIFEIDGEADSDDGACEWCGAENDES